MTFKSLRHLAPLALLALAAGCQTTSSAPTEIDKMAEAQGLVRVQNKNVDLVYRRPEAKFDSYTKFLLKAPIEVQFSKDWKPETSGSVIYRMDAPDREKIKRELSEVFVEVVKRDMEKGGYPMVDVAAPEVLELRAAIVNLYINAPDVMTAGRSKTYTSDAGEMTLILELHDSVTGQLLAMAIDQRASNGPGTWTWTNSVTNTAEAKQIISVWATQLRKALDASRAQG